MKKILLLMVLVSVPYCVNAFPLDITPVTINQVHDRQMLEEQLFRIEEINDYKEVKEEKARFEKKNQPVEKQLDSINQQIQQKQKQITAPSQRSEFIEENGQLKIKYY